MTGGEIAVLVGVCVAFVAALGAAIYGKLKHKNGCCGCCKCSDKADSECKMCRKIIDKR